MKTELLKENYLQKAKDIIENDGVIAFPTDTVYGLCCNAFSSEAIEKIYQLKGREHTKALIIMIPQNYDISNLVKNVSEIAKRLMQNFWPGALTIIFESKNILPKNATGGLTTVGVRIPDNQIALELINYLNIPLCTTSANISGEQSPIYANEVLKYFDGKLELVIDGGVCDKKIPSTICDATKEDINILRVGSISIEKIKQILEN